MSTCVKCGQPLPEGAVFCPLCGKKQVSIPQQSRSRRTRPSGSGSVYKRGSTWEAAYVYGYIIQDDGSKKTVRSTKGGFKTKKEALEYLPNLKKERPRKVPTMQELYTVFTSSRKFSELTDSRKEKYTIAWEKIKRLWFTRIDLITTFDLQDTLDAAADTYYPARDIKNLYSKLYKTAMPDQFVTVNLSDYVELPPLKAKPREPFLLEEIQKLWADYAAGNWWTGYILLMVYTGMMPGELLGARKEHIDWENKQIVGAGLKTETRRTKPIILADFMIPVLADLCDHTTNDKIIQISKDNFYTVYYKTLERAGVRRLTPYSCRHTAASTLAEENIQPSIIQNIMRHARFSSTERYIHIDTKSMHEAVNKLPNQA